MLRLVAAIIVSTLMMPGAACAQAKNSKGSRYER
jgi:hypothetical protein